MKIIAVAFNSLSTYITMNFDGLKDAIVNMLAGVPEKVDVLTLLIHLGYLCYDADTGIVYIPNKEVRQITLWP